MVYIRNLKKNIFPFYIPPYEDELFSSWICRLSYNHGVKSRTFIKNYILDSNPNIWNRDVDLMPPSYLKDLIYNHTLLSKEKVENLFLSKYIGKSFYKISSTTKNVLALGVNHRQRNRFGLQCCILCLRESNPYYKTSWRLLTTIVCIRHKCLLIDRCQLCGSPIAFYRAEFGGNQSVLDNDYKQLYNCYHCGCKIEDFEPKYVSDFNLNYQKEINEILTIGKYKNESSILYINVLFLLSRRLTSDTKDNRLRNGVNEVLNVIFLFNKEEMKFWSVEQRSQIFPFVHNLIHNEYHTLKYIFNEYFIIKARVINNDWIIPSYLDSLFYAPFTNKSK
ncbi:MAG: TniQ family protein [Flavobacteriales bacterium]|jgi:hypothetical protein|nr:TniQ family protein [Flavobacteriales bacterium]